MLQDIRNMGTGTFELETFAALNGYLDFEASIEPPGFVAEIAR